MTHAIDGNVFLSEPGRLVPARIAWDDAGRIVEIRRLGAASDLPVILPGFIDEHIHGAAGHDVMEAQSSSWQAIETALARHGVTGFLATTVTAAWPDLMGVLDCAQQYDSAQLGTFAGGQSILLGLHWEGPYLDKAFKGAQPEEFIRPMGDVGELVRILAASTRQRIPLRLMTVAPEQSGGYEAIRLMVHGGVQVNLGHSGASERAGLLGVDAGANGITHLFNAMHGLHHREPGLVGAALSSPKMWVELITDGIHIHPSVIRMVFGLASSRLILVTDGISAIDCPPGKYRLGKWQVDVDATSARLEGGTLAGSILTPDQSVRNLLEWGIPLAQVVRGWSESPARRLGLEGQGSVREGGWADLAVMDGQWRVLGTIKHGHWIYRAL